MNTEEVIFANILEQRQLVREAGSLSKQRRRREKLPSQDERPSGPVESRDSRSQLTEIKPFPVEIWESE